MVEVFNPGPRNRGDLLTYINDRTEAYFKKRYKTIGLILLPKDAVEGVEGPLDPKITDLVRVLNPLGIETMGSCQGHLDGRRYPFPWVSYRDPFGAWGPKILQLIIDPFNLRSEIPWTASGAAVRPVHEARNEDELRVLQESSQEFANTLFTLFLENRRIPYVNLFRD